MLDFDLCGENISVYLQIFSPFLQLSGTCSLFEANHVVESFFFVLAQQKVFQGCLAVRRHGTSRALLPAEFLVLLFPLICLKVSLSQSFVPFLQIQRLVEILYPLQILDLQFRQRLRLLHHLVQPYQVVRRELRQLTLAELALDHLLRVCIFRSLHLDVVLLEFF